MATKIIPTASSYIIGIEPKVELVCLSILDADDTSFGVLLLDIDEAYALSKKIADMADKIMALDTL